MNKSTKIETFRHDRMTHRKQGVAPLWRVKMPGGVMSSGFVLTKYIQIFLFLNLPHVSFSEQNNHEMVYHGNQSCFCFLVGVFVFLVLYTTHRFYGWITPPVLRRQIAVGFGHALNGSHGEYTVSDDVRQSLFYMVEEEVDVLELNFGENPLHILLSQQPVQNFNLLAGQACDICDGPMSLRSLIRSMHLFKLCISEEEFGGLDYTDILYDLLIFRCETLKHIKEEVGREVVHFLRFDINTVVECLGRSPRSSQLRSSHGEITEGDDMVMKWVPKQSGAAINADNKRASREEETNRHRMCPGRGTKGSNKFGPPEHVETEGGGGGVVVEVKDTRKTELLVIDIDNSGILVPFASYRHSYLVAKPIMVDQTLTVVNCLWEDAISGERYTDIVCAGTFMANYHNDCGVMVLQPKHKGAVARFPFVYVAGCGIHPSGWYYRPARMLLSEKFGAVKPTESVIRAYISRLVQTYPRIPLEVLQFTADVHTQHLLSLNVSITAMVDIPISKAPPPELPSFRGVLNGLSAYSKLNVGLTVRQYVECDIRPPQQEDKRRYAFEVLQSKGARLEDGALIYNTPKGDKPLRKYLVALDMVGHEEFERAAVTANNQAAALTRVLKARGGSLESDQEYTLNQLEILFDLVPPLDFILTDARLEITPTAYTFSSVKSTNHDLLLERKGKRYDKRTLELCQYIRSKYTAKPSEYFLVRQWTYMFNVVDPLLRNVAYASTVIWMVFFHVISFRYFYSDLPHAKRTLRKTLGMKLANGEAYVGGNYVNEITAEVKDENMKYDKPPRLFFSLGLFAPLYGGYWLDMAKQYMKRERYFECNGFIAYVEFLPDNSPEAIADWFARAYERVHSNEKSVSFVTCGDDMAMVSNIDGPMFWEVDISSCDASVGTGMFNLVSHQLLAMGVPQDQVRGLVGQCTKPFRIRNPNNLGEFLLAKFFGYYLISGTVLTTFAGTWSSMMIIGSILAGLEQGLREPEDFAPKVKDLGFVVTIEPRTHFVGLTFMRRFGCPSVDGKILAPQCLGAVGKSLGKIIPELSESVIPNSRGMTLEQRAEIFLGAVLEGWKNEPSYQFLNNLRKSFKFKQEVKEQYLDHLRRQYKSPVRGNLDEDALCLRYGFTRFEYEELCGALNGLRLGDRLHSDVLTKIFSIDYGMSA